MRERRLSPSARRLATVTLIVGASLSLASSCDTEPSADTADAADVMAADFTSDLSIPEQSDVVEKFYDSHAEECPNVELGAGPDDEFMDRISNAANGAGEGATMEDVLLEFCEGA